MQTLTCKKGICINICCRFDIFVVPCSVVVQAVIFQDNSMGTGKVINDTIAGSCRIFRTRYSVYNYIITNSGRKPCSRRSGIGISRIHVYNCCIMDSVKDIVLDQDIMEPTAKDPTNPFYARIGSGIIENIVVDVHT